MVQTKQTATNHWTKLKHLRIFIFVYLIYYKFNFVAVLRYIIPDYYRKYNCRQNELLESQKNNT